MVYSQKSVCGGGGGGQLMSWQMLFEGKYKVYEYLLAPAWGHRACVTGCIAAFILLLDPGSPPAESEGPAQAQARIRYV